MKNILVVLLIFLLCQCSTKKFQILNVPVKNGITLSDGKLNIQIRFYEDNAVRVQKWTLDSKPDKKSLVIVKDSLADLSISTKDSGDFVSLQSKNLKVLVSKSNGQVSYKKTNGANILKEEQVSFQPFGFKGDKGFSFKQSFAITPDEGIYGLGTYQEGKMNYRNSKILMVQSNTEDCNPMLVSTRNYGILWDNYSKTIYSDSANVASLWSEMGDNLDYYFIAGNNTDEVIAGYRDLTGKAPMYGRWAFGYWQSYCNYKNRDELLGVAKKYRQLQIPIDNIVQDWDYWNGNANWGSMNFDPKLYPKPEEMVQELHKMNFHLMLSIWPAMGPNTEIYKDFLSKGLLYKPVGWAGFKFLDAYNPAARELYWKYLNDGIISKGIDALWVDASELDLVNVLTKEATNYELKKMDNNFLGSFARYLNTFSLVQTDGIYKNWRKESDKERKCIVTRSVFAGQQRNAATTWSGDIGANWTIYKNQIAAGVNFCMSGVPYWSFDIGAFLLGGNGGVFPNGGKTPAYQELYTRMFQFAAFTPIFRSHGTETPREIWEMGDLAKVLIQYDNLRYRLLPYIYSLAGQVTQNDYTMMRGLPMDFPNDKATFNINNEYMFGNAFLVSPVTDFMYNRPPEASVVIAPKYFKTLDGKQGLTAKYYKDDKYKVLGKEQVDPNINFTWYGGRPAYVTDSMYSIRWEGKLIPPQDGKYQFHVKCFDANRILLDGKKLSLVYKDIEQYTEVVELKSNKEYSFVVETENGRASAARIVVEWKTPELFANENQKVESDKTQRVYLPSGTKWVDFWTGNSFEGGQTIMTNAPIEIMPLFVKAGSVVPMGPFMQYSTEKPADPIELRVYPGANGSFTLYEDENDNYNYEKGMFATIRFEWNDVSKTLTINKRQGEFPGMLKQRTFKIVVVGPNHGTGIGIEAKPDKTVQYNGEEVNVKF